MQLKTTTKVVLILLLTTFAYKLGQMTELVMSNPTAYNDVIKNPRTGSKNTNPGFFCDADGAYRDILTSKYK